MELVAGVTASDVALLTSIERELAKVEIGGAPALEKIKEPLRELLQCTYSLGYGIYADDEELRCAFLHSQLPAAIRDDVDRSLERNSVSKWGKYDLRSPEASQRNRARAFTADDLAGTGAEPCFAATALPSLKHACSSAKGPACWPGSVAFATKRSPSASCGSSSVLLDRCDAG